jgi:hypothetical protein
MATGTIPPTILPPPPPAPVASIQHERIIQRQLRRTSRHVRLVDLACSVAIWSVGVLLLFIIAAVVDHFVGLGIIGRFLALAVLLGGSAYYLTLRTIPLLVRAINPSYAARTIEEATPTLKNSLINFLMLRQDRSGIKEIVYQAVEEKAARDIAAVPVEATVDRTPLIHAGYVLCGVMALFAAYKILSPKDPFQTIARVLAPWADIPRPSRVQITDIQPANAEVYHGQTVKISALIRGARENDAVKVLYSTADGQSIDRPVEMTLGAAGLRHECTLPPSPGSGEPLSDTLHSGLQQDVTYRITAGDAESSLYRLRVVAAPTIIVDRLDFSYPPYTKKSADAITQQGDIKALEGTKVTIHAVANQPIKSAWVEFDPTTDGGSSEIVPLQADGPKAKGTITLLLKSDRQTPWHDSYQVRYYNHRDQKSQQPILHKIDVIRDLPPEVQLLQPQRLRMEVPEDGEQTIEVRAVDPDFGLSSVRIEGSAGAKPAVNINLLPADSDQLPQATVPYLFRPREHHLAAGDELNYTAVAEDNRTNPQNGEPQPNIAKTAEYTLVVTAPRNKQGNEHSKPQGNSKGNEPKNSKSSPDGKQPNETPPRSASEGKPPPNSDQKNQQKNQQQGDKNQQDRQQQPPAGQQDNQKQSGNPSGQDKNEQQRGNQSQQPEKSDGGQQNQPQQGQQPQDGQQQPQQGGTSSDGTAGGSPQQGTSGASGQQGASGNQSGAAGQSSENRQPGAGASGQQGESTTGNSGQPNGSGERQGKAHDGEAFEKVYQELQKDGQSPNTSTRRASEGSQSPDRKDASARESDQTKQPGAQPTEAPMNQGQTGNQQGQKAEGQKAGAEQGGQPQSSGQSGTQTQNTPTTGTPSGNDQKLDPKGQGQAAQGNQEKKGDAKSRLPDEQQGQNPSQQKSGGNEGGAPQGPSKTDKGEKSSDAQGEKRDPGAGKTGDEGAGAASKDKSGSGDSTRENRDRKKELKPDSDKPEQGETSAASSSKKQSDSKGGQSGDESGGGKQGAGQSAGQEGNDSSGSKSAADQGAGKANETGSGETGSKAGGQQQAAGKTGQSGDQSGKGSASRPSEAGGNQPPDSPSETNQDQQPKTPDGADGKTGSSTGPITKGGGDGNRAPIETPSTAEVEAADAANLEYSRKVTDMVLKRLKDEEHKADPELLDKLGWTREDLAEFIRRWEALQQLAQEAPDGKRELDEALRSLGLRDPNIRKRAGGTTSDSQRDLRDAGNRSSPPSNYRDLFDAFRKGAARTRE